MTAPLRFPYRVAAANADEAVREAKAIAHAEGYVLRTVASCRQAATDGQWVVTLVVVLPDRKAVRA